MSRSGAHAAQALHHRQRIGCFITAILLCALPAVGGNADSSSSKQSEARAYYGKLPLSFELNQGQADNRVKFLARGAGYQLFLTADEAALAITPAAHRRQNGLERNTRSDQRQGAGASNNTTLRMRLHGADASVSAIGLEQLPGKTNYFIGNDPKKWRTNVPTYAKVKYQGVYPGIDLVYYGNQDGQLEYDFIVAPGSDAGAISFSIERYGDSRGRNVPLSVDANGDLVLHDSPGGIRFQKPIVYQERSDGSKEYRDGHYVLDSESTGVQAATVSFSVGNYDHSKPLVIDPAITYSTILAGTIGESAFNRGNGIAVFTDPSTGHVYAYIVGETCQSDFPMANARQSFGGAGTTNPCGDGFITKFDPTASGNASVIYSTYLGGIGSDSATGIAVDSTGNAYVSGWTQSVDFPTTQNAYLPVPFGNSQTPSDAFLTKLSADGTTLMYSTYFGGSGQDAASAIATGSPGLAYIAGSTSSTDLPTANPFQATAVNSTGNAFVAAFDTTAAGPTSLVYSTYLGGSSTGFYGDSAGAIAVDSTGTIHVGGQARSIPFPVANGFQLSPSGGGPYGGAFYTRLDPSRTGSAQLLYSTYLGGSNGYGYNTVDTITALALDSLGNVYLTGDIASGAYPVTTNVGQGLPGYVFVTKINPSAAGASSLVYSTAFFTGSGSSANFAPASNAIAVDGSGNAFVAGGALPGLQLVNPVYQSANGILQSSNGGQTWTLLNQGLTGFPILALAIDTSTSPRTMYAGTGVGTLLESTDGGLNWQQVLQVPSTDSTTCTTAGFATGATTNVCVMSLAVDPTNPSNVYAGTTAGVYKSTDRGTTWTAFNAGLSSAAVQGVAALQFDNCLPQCTTLYAGATDGLYKLGSGATSWSSSGLSATVGSISIDPNTNPHTIFASSGISGEFPPFGSYRGVAGGNTWTAINPFISALGVDTAPVPSTLYGFDDTDGYGTEWYIWNSTNEGNTWTHALTSLGYTSSGGVRVNIAVDTNTKPSSTVYSNQIGSDILKSTDGGNTWTTVFGGSTVSGRDFGRSTLDALVVDSTTSASTLYAATAIPSASAFVAELNPSGTGFLFSTYLGDLIADTWANAVALDAADNIYVTGATEYPLYFPEVNAFQIPTKSNGTSAFFTVLGNQTLPASSSGAVTSNVGVQNGTLAITLPNITGSTTTSAPTLTVNAVPSTTTATFGLSNNLGAYDISTTASYSGSVTVCFQAQTVNDPTTFNNLELFHIVNGTSVDITSSRDFSTRTVCGVATSLSPFVLFSPTTSTMVAASLNPALFGESVTFTATAAASGGVPSGSVTFYDGANNLGTQALNSSGQATLSVASLTGGSHTITAVYGGNSPLLGSTSAPYAETVNQGSTATVVTTSGTPSILNQSITLTATVSVVAPASGVPTSTVTFYDGATLIGTAPLNANAQGTLTTSSLGVGTHSITAMYGGDANFSGSTSAPLSQLVQYEPAASTCLGAAGHQILQPINSDGSSVWKQGRTIPTQFRVCDANGVSVGTPGVVSSFYLTQVISGTVSNVDETVTSNSSDTAFHWDATNQQWVFNIGTKTLAAGNTYVYTITLNDGSAIVFQYGLK